MNGLANLFQVPFIAKDSGSTNGIFELARTGGLGIENSWQTIGVLLGSICILAGVLFGAIGVFKTRDKAKWFWFALLGFVVGGVLLSTGTVMSMRKGAGNTYDEVFSGKGASDGNSGDNASGSSSTITVLTPETVSNTFNAFGK